VTQMLEFSERFDLGKYGWPGAPLHDPAFIAYLLKPDLFEGRHINVSIGKPQAELTHGHDRRRLWVSPAGVKNCTYIRSGDADGFYKLLSERLKRLP